MLKSMFFHVPKFSYHPVILVQNPFVPDLDRSFAHLRNLGASKHGSLSTMRPRLADATPARPARSRGRNPLGGGPRRKWSSSRAAVDPEL